MSDDTLIKALEQIATFPRGGLVETGKPSGDRDEMIGIARQALQPTGRWADYYAQHIAP